jgi:hypothetical protein
MARLTNKPILVMRTPGSSLLLETRYVLSWLWWWWCPGPEWCLEGWPIMVTANEEEDGRSWIIEVREGTYVWMWREFKGYRDVALWVLKEIPPRESLVLGRVRSHEELQRESICGRKEGREWKVGRKGLQRDYYWLVQYIQITWLWVMIGASIC